MSRKLLFLHPFLFALYTVLFLYGRNISEYPETVIFVPIFFSFLFAAVTLFLARIFLRRFEKAALVSSVVVLLCLSYSRFLGLFKELNIHIGGIVIPHEVIVFLGSLFVCSVSVYGVRRYKKQLHKLNELFLVSSLILLVFPLYTISAFEAKTGRVFTIDFASFLPTISLLQPGKKEPDIYYFIFDRYAGQRSLSEQYNFDNSAFLTFLKNNGFYVATEATANYPKTFLSLGSSLNYEYLDYLTEKTNGGESPDESIVTPLIRNNNVIKFLKERGYSYVHIGPGWTPTSINPNADTIYIFKDGLYPRADEFTTGFLNTTIAAPLFQYMFRDTSAVSEDPENNDHRKRVLYEFNAIEQAIPLPGPKFVFMHVLFPHDPFVFGKECQPIPESEVKKHDHVTNYLNQLTCANSKIMATISDILVRSKTQPIIIVQSDEGPFPMNVPIPENQSWGTAETSSLKEKFPILSVYYLPGVSTKELYPSITPVNSFRVVFNAYFGTNLPLLPDRNYIYQDKYNYYKFIDVTDRIK